MQLLLLVAILVLFRFLPHPPNVAPFAAFALVGGIFLGRWTALLVPLAALVVSDGVLNIAAGFPMFMPARLVDYGVFLGIAWMGVLARDRGLATKGVAVLATPFVFFLLSNFGVWLFGVGVSGLPYAKSVAGLIECYAAGLPFLRGTVISDWAFVLILCAALLPMRRSSRVCEAF